MDTAKLANLLNRMAAANRKPSAQELEEARINDSVRAKLVQNTDPFLDEPAEEVVDEETKRAALQHVRDQNAMVDKTIYESLMQRLQDETDPARKDMILRKLQGL